MKRNRVGLFATALAVAVLVGSAACTAKGLPTPGPQPADDHLTPVEVRRGDIVSVVAVDAVVVATPVFVIWSAGPGSVKRRPVRSGARVVAGQVMATQPGRSVAAPVSGVFVEWLVPDGMQLKSANIPIASMRYDGFAVTGELPPAMAYRIYGGALGAQAQVVDGPGPFECILLPMPGVTSPASPPAPTVQVACAAPATVTLYPGVKALIGLRTAQRRNVLVLPATAVTAKAGQGRVWKLVDGRPAETPVSVGVTDGVSVEIVSGLAEGDQVLPYSPLLRPRVG